VEPSESNFCIKKTICVEMPNRVDDWIQAALRIDVHGSFLLQDLTLSLSLFFFSRSHETTLVFPFLAMFAHRVGLCLAGCDPGPEADWAVRRARHYDAISKGRLEGNMGARLH
jgi:hypothetical protein